MRCGGARRRAPLSSTKGVVLGRRAQATPCVGARRRAWARGCERTAGRARSGARRPPATRAARGRPAAHAGPHALVGAASSAHSTRAGASGLAALAALPALGAASLAATLAAAAW